MSVLNALNLRILGILQQDTHLYIRVLSFKFTLSFFAPIWYNFIGDYMEKGILLPIFSLPSKYGVGDFGKEAYEFIDILSENNIKYWEILPINDGGQYPYSPRSYYALNKTYISIDFLIDLGLIHNV